MSYQPGIPTGTVNLDQDYQNIQTNFTQLNTQFGVDHIPFANNTPLIAGYHKAVHFNPFSAAPAFVAGYGQQFTIQRNDGVSISSQLYFLSGTNDLIAMTRNFKPLNAVNGYTFLPGGLIMQWGTAPITAGPVIINFPLAFPAAAFNIVLTMIKTPASMPGSQACFISALSNTQFTAYFAVNATLITDFYWTAIGN